MWARFAATNAAGLFFLTCLGLPSWGQDRAQGFVWRPSTPPAFREPDARDASGIRFQDSVKLLRHAHQGLRGELAPTGGFSRVFYPFGGADPLPLTLGAKTVISGGLEPFGTPSQLERELSRTGALEFTSSSYAKYSYLHIWDLAYHHRKSVGQDFLALASHVFEIQVTEIRYFDDRLEYARSPEEIESDPRRFRHAEITAGDGRSDATFYYLQTNMSSERPGPWFEGVGLSSSVSPALFQLLQDVRPDGLLMKAHQGLVLAARLQAAFTASAEDRVISVGAIPSDFLDAFFARQITILGHDGPFGYSELEAEIPLTVLDKATSEQIAAHVQRPRGLVERLAGFLGLVRPSALPQASKTVRKRPSLGAECADALRSWKASLKQRGPVQAPARITI